MQVTTVEQSNNKACNCSLLITEHGQGQRRKESRLQQPASAQRAAQCSHSQSRGMLPASLALCHKAGHVQN
jgi:hypothetical protein